MWLLLLVPALPLVASVVIVLARPAPTTASRWAVLAAAGAVVAAVVLLGGLVASALWSLVLTDDRGRALLGLTADRVGAVLALLTVLVGLVIQSFAARALEGDPGQRRFAVLAGVLTGSTALVALSATGLGLAVGWVATGAALVGLVGHHRPWPQAVDAASRTRRAFAVSDVALVVAVLIMVLVAGDVDLRDLAPTASSLSNQRLPGPGQVSWLTVTAMLLVVAGIARSALVPVHRWLPATIAAPTPVSALLHAGVVNGIGVLLLRFSPIVGASAPALWLAFVAGTVTALLATGVMLVRTDVKGGLAWSTAGQMGFMTVQLAVGAPAAALFHLLGHAMYKAALFLGAGGAISAQRRARHLPHSPAPLPRPARLAIAVLVPAASIAVTMIVITAALGARLTVASSTLVVVFGWLCTARLVNGWLRAATPSPSPSIVALGVLAGAAAPAGYIAAVVAFEAALGDAVSEALPAAVGATWLWATLALAAIGVATLWIAGGASGARWRRRLYVALVGAGAPPLASQSRPSGAPTSPVRRSGDGHPRPDTRMPPAAARAIPDELAIAAVRADVTTASQLIAPSWPLTSFVAVNPLGGFAHLDFDEACARARRWFGATTHLSLERYRALHRSGEIADAQLHVAILASDPGLASIAPVRLGERDVNATELVRRDLLAGPTPEDDQRTDGRAGTPRSASVDAYVASWCAAFIDEAGAALGMPDRDLGFFRSWRRLAEVDPRLRRLVGHHGHAWVMGLPQDPAAALQRALDALGVTEDDRLDALRALVVRLPGWAALGRWADEWAPADHPGPRLGVLDLVTVVAVLDVASHPRAASTEPEAESELEPERETAQLDRRIAWVIESTSTGPVTEEQRTGVADILRRVPEPTRAAIWLTAHEGGFRDRLLGLLQRVDPGPLVERPAAQLVHCIDVRSEVLRRHLEGLGPYETFGFAGFFGVPTRWRPLGSDAAEARCPVLVTPRHTSGEALADNSWSSTLPIPRALAAARGAAHDAKGSLGSPFALAESAGWLLGPAAALRTVAPTFMRRIGRPWRRLAAPPRTRAVVGLPFDQQVLYAEAIVQTMGMRRFAPLIVLCGHRSATVNNPHASSLDCGACAGAPGGASARVAAAVLNDPAVRERLAEGGTSINEDAWFVAAEHETVSDRVAILDRHLVPGRLAGALAQLERDLDIAGARTAAERAVRLPGDPGQVRHRGRDWAQVRPEWGLAGNAAMVIGPRSVTRELPLAGRAFLHDYRADADPDGTALETILTAPLIVAQWISAQYYFSTVSPGVFGAGDKMVHNPVGGVGVTLGDIGDLAMGLPRQSVAFGDLLGHDPLRLLAVVQAPLERIEGIMARNRELRDLVEQRWITVAGRSHGHEGWSLRSPSGTWQTWHPAEHQTAPIALEPP